MILTADQLLLGSSQGRACGRRRGRKITCGVGVQNL